MNIFSYEPFSLPPSRVCSAFGARVHFGRGDLVGRLVFVCVLGSDRVTSLPPHSASGRNKWHWLSFERLLAFLVAKSSS